MDKKVQSSNSLTSIRQSSATITPKSSKLLRLVPNSHSDLNKSICLMSLTNHDLSPIDSKHTSVQVPEKATYDWLERKNSFVKFS